MKKLLFTIALLLGGISFLQGQIPKEFFETFRLETNAQLITLDEDMLSMAKAQAGEDADKLKNIESVVVLELSGCDQSVKDKFEEAIGNLQLDGYETLVRVNEEDVTVKVMGKVEDDTVHDVVVVITGEAYVLVQMTGSISMSDVSSIVNSNS